MTPDGHFIAAGGVPVNLDWNPVSFVTTDEKIISAFLNLIPFTADRGGLNFRSPARLNAAVDQYPTKTPEEISRWARCEVQKIADGLEREARTCPTCGNVRDYDLDDWLED